LNLGKPLGVKNKFRLTLLIVELLIWILKWSQGIELSQLLMQC